MLYLVKPEYIRFERTTDAVGRFSLTDVSGRDVDIEAITKSGYEVEPNMVRVYGRTNGTSDQPLVVRMWQTDIKETLLKGEHSFQTVPDGTAYAINLTNGAILSSETQNADLRVWVKMLKKIDDRNSDWACEIRVINGGLVEELDSASPMYLAPAEGYTTVFHLSVDATNVWNRSSSTLRFFVRLKNGAEYGRFAIDFAAYHRSQGLMRIEYAINPSGSRILR